VPRLAAAESPSARWNRTSQRLATRRHYLNGFLGDLKARTYLQLIARWGGLPRTGLVLKTDLFEEASGPDAFFDALSANGASAIGIDLSFDCTARARKRGGHGSRCLTADSRRLPFGDQAFALIVSPSTLDHFDDPAD